jgi:L-ribulose-5-phosphate 3-epimerase UlaE
MCEPRCPECGNLLKLQDAVIDELEATIMKLEALLVKHEIAVYNKPRGVWGEPPLLPPQGFIHQEVKVVKESK